MRIIRTRQRPVLLWVDTALTLLAWIGLLYLLARGLWPLLQSHGGPRLEIGLLNALTTLQIYFWVAVFNAAVLIGWARYRQFKARSYPPRQPAPVVDDRRLSESFSLSADNFSRMRRLGTLIVHNDDEGGITHVSTPLLMRMRPEERWPVTQSATRHLAPGS